MLDLTVQVDTITLRNTLAKNYSDYQRAWAETEVKWQATAVAALADAKARALILDAQTAARPAEQMEIGGEDGGPLFNVPAKGYSEALLKLGKEVAKVFHDRPKDFSDEYQEAISMLEAHQGKTIELSATEFRHLMADDWDWRRTWRDMITSVDDHAQHYLGG